MKRGHRFTREQILNRIDAARRRRPVTPAWLAAKYLDERLDCVKIGLLVSRDPKTVWTWLKHDGVQMRPRGTACPALLFRKGHVSPFTGRRHSEETKSRLREIAIADGRVPFDPAVGSYMRGRRGADTPNWKGGVTPERQALYSSAEWVAAVKMVWARADARCERCGVHHNACERRGTFHIHHVVSFAVRELRAEPTNLALLCGGCHRFVHSRANVAGNFLGAAMKQMSLFAADA